MRRLFRVFYVLHIVAKNRLDQLLPSQLQYLPFKIFLRSMPSAWFRRPKTSKEDRLRLTLVELGPVFIKLGQMLSTRPDALPPAIIHQLELLQDQVPPFDSDVSIAIIETELKKPITELFLEFEREPMASASVAQVHAARLLGGEEVVVKVIRPGIAKTIKQDFAILLTASRWLEQIWPEIRRFHPHKIVGNYQKIILSELDLDIEASNTAKFRRSFKDSNLLYVPDICFDYSTRNVMVAERIYGIPVTDTDTMRQRGVDMQVLAERGVQIFFTQVFKHNFFHADMHPGNIFVDISNPEQPRYISIDCAIAGSLSKQDQLFMARGILALLQQDYLLLAQLALDADWLPTDTPTHEFSVALQTVIEPIFERPLDEIDFGPVLIRLYQLAQAFQLEVKPQFVLLQKTLLHIEGLGRQLLPSLDVWSIGRPLMERWMKDQLGPKAVWSTVKQDFPLWVQQLPKVPLLITGALEEIKTTHSQTRQLLQQLEEQKQQLKSQRRRDLAWLTLASVALVSGITAAWGRQLQQAFLEIPSISWALGGAAAVIILLRLLSGKNNN
ncbi:MAG TPA: 2-polyprenylphenol 6-hydroxylase [Pseudomonadales bacterium]